MDFYTLTPGTMLRICGSLCVSVLHPFTLVTVVKSPDTIYSLSAVYLYGTVNASWRDPMAGIICHRATNEH